MCVVRINESQQFVLEPTEEEAAVRASNLSVA